MMDRVHCEAGTEGMIGGTYARKMWPILLALPLAFAAPARAAEASCVAPIVLGDGWKTAEPQASGFDAAALCAVLERVAGDASNIHGVVVERRGRLVAELYRRGKDRSIWSLFARETEFAPTVLHDLRSVSKSVVGLLVGSARQQGKVDVAASALAYYPSYADLRSPERDAITVEHLLTMSSGLECTRASRRTARSPTTRRVCTGTGNRTVTY